MPELVEQMYCSQQIVIPPKFPYILKRYCKAAIKTQPYDLLRWSYEYFKALALHRPPPVKLRLEYPVYSTEGGLTRGCLKVLAVQLSTMNEVPISVIKAAWGGFCLDPNELKRVLCLAEAYLRYDSMPFLHFIAVAGGLLTKSLTHTMILLCESLTKEPDGGSAAIPIEDFLVMYNFLAKIDASKDVRYYNGYREGQVPEPEPVVEEEPTEEVEEDANTTSDDFWLDEDSEGLQKLTLIDAHVAKTAKLSTKMNMPAVGKIERSPSIERLGQIERDNYARERKGRPSRSNEVDQKLKELRERSEAKLSHTSLKEEIPKAKEEKVVEKKNDEIVITVYDEDDNKIPYEIYGEPTDNGEVSAEQLDDDVSTDKDENKQDMVEKHAPSLHKKKVKLFIADLLQSREARLLDIESTFDDIARIVHRYKSANYDLGMVAGRQMSTTSGEFIVDNIDKEILAYIDDQIAVLPDPDLKKKKAKPEEVDMIRGLLDKFIDENMEVIVPEVEDVEEEEAPIPEITLVYAVPGIGAAVEEDIIREFVQFARESSKVQGELFMPRNIRHFMCPPLEKYVESDYEGTPQSHNNDENNKEEAPTGGAITD